jgi:hypothetical protein
VTTIPGVYDQVDVLVVVVEDEDVVVVDVGSISKSIFVRRSDCGDGSSVSSTILSRDVCVG